MVTVRKDVSCLETETVKDLNTFRYRPRLLPQARLHCILLWGITSGSSAPRLVLLSDHHDTPSHSNLAAARAVHLLSVGRVTPDTAVWVRLPKTPNSISAISRLQQAGVRRVIFSLSCLPLNRVLVGAPQSAGELGEHEEVLTRILNVLRLES